MRGYTDMIRLTEPLSESGRKLVGRALYQSERMSSLVENLLLLARLDAEEKTPGNTHGAQTVHKNLDLGELVMDAVMDATAAGRDHVWESSIPDEPVTVYASRSQLVQLLGNLLSNARKHTPAGTVVQTTLVTERGRAVLTVTDNGPGIDPRVKGTLFDRFVRGDSVRTTTEGSTGLGLSIVRSVARAHGGEATVTSRRGKTEFRVELPLARG